MLEKIANINDKERNAIFLETASIKQIPASMIEKDFWVCWVLNRLFLDEQLQKILCFKGGTSLSKVFNLIDRFSEDIDLILDWTTVLNGKEIRANSKTQQDRRNKEINEAAQAYIATELKNKIKDAVGDICVVSPDESDGNTLQIKYPKSISDKYILPHIKLEIGPLAAWLPNKKYSIKPYIDVLNNININEIIVPTIVLERTFWEKVTILHREHYRQQHQPSPARYSRHYYDLYKIGQSVFADKAISEKDLLAQVVDFKSTFYPCGWARYDLAATGTLKLIPNEANIKLLKDDYKKMKGMIFGDYPTWDEILSFLEELQDKINS